MDHRQTDLSIDHLATKIFKKAKDLNDFIDDAVETDRTIGPFERTDPNPGALEITKTLFNACWLLPIRVVLVTGIILFYYTLALSYLFIFPTSKRDTLRTTTSYLSRIAMFLCGFHWIETYGNPEDIDRIGTDTHIIMLNHIGIWEVLYFMSTKCSPSFVFKKGCLKVPIVGVVAREILKGLCVDNDRGTGVGKSSAEILLNHMLLMKNSKGNSFRPLLLFPEGTTTNGTCLINFRTGGFIAGMPIKPVLINFPFRRFSPSYESIYTSVLLFRTLCQFHNRMQVRYLPVYYPDELEQQNPKLYAENLRSYMALAMNVPKCDASVQEKKLYHGILASRFAKHWGGQWSNFWLVNPKQPNNHNNNDDENNNDELIYKYYRPKSTPMEIKTDDDYDKKEDKNL